MSGFFVDETAKPSGLCIWDGCGKPSVAVLGSESLPFSMEVCEDHGKMFEDADVVPCGDGISIRTFLDTVAEKN